MDQKRELGCSSCQPKRAPILTGCIPLFQPGSLNATAELQLMQAYRPPILILLSALEDEVQLPGLLLCSSSTPSSSQQTKSRKRKQDAAVDLLQYLERSEERFLEQIRRHQDLTTAMLQNIQRTDGN